MSEKHYCDYCIHHTQRDEGYGEYEDHYEYCMLFGWKNPNADGCDRYAEEGDEDEKIDTREAADSLAEDEAVERYYEKRYNE